MFGPAQAQDMYTRTQPTPLTLTLSTLLWGMHFIGHRTLDVVRLLVGSRATFAKLPLLRFLLIGSLLAVLFQDSLEFTITVGGKAAPTEQHAAQAVLTSSAQPLVSPTATAGLLSSWLSSATSTPAKPNDKVALALLERFEHVAAAEASRFGLDAGVLLATAIATTDGQLGQDHRPFGVALQQDHESAWAAWRAMSLTVMAQVGSKKPSGRKGWVQAFSELYPNPAQMRSKIEFSLARYSL